MSVAYRDAECVKVVVQLLVVGPEIYDTSTFLLYQVLDLVIVISLILTADDEDGRGGHTLQRIPAGIYVGSL